HVHGGALGWNGMMTFGMIYWLLPRIFQTKLYSKKLAEWHFWLGTIGILLYIVPIYVAGLTQGLMWRAIDEQGNLMYPKFIETVQVLMPMYWIRVGGGMLFLLGAVLCLYNFIRTWMARPAVYEEPVFTAPKLTNDYVDAPAPVSQLEAVLEMGKKLDVWSTLWWHRRWERLPLKFTVWVVIAVVAATLFELVPSFLIRSNIPPLPGVKPYTPLELAGRDLYVANGCYNCHSQMIRPILAETKRYGPYSKPGEFVYDHPFQWGSRRIGPDLAREGGAQNALWHTTHFREPTNTSPGSIMPAYPSFEQSELNFSTLSQRVKAHNFLAGGTAYKPEVIDNAEAVALVQAKQIANDIIQQNGGPGSLPKNLERTQLVAMIAYLQRLGVEQADTPPAKSPATDSKPVAAK
ncbi:MAG TPA: cytochrome-c oxidase, cbb3-type subunit II, partial [Gemmatales bacterium]|nr:cytochrome-c oxidase, cbb3-type subunit II [Gemmatales bacterium]